MDNATRKTLAGYLHAANKQVVAGKNSHLPTWERNQALNEASGLIKEVIETLMDGPGMTDFYGNPTARPSQDDYDYYGADLPVTDDFGNGA